MLKPTQCSMDQEDGSTARGRRQHHRPTGFAWAAGRILLWTIVLPAAATLVVPPGISCARDGDLFSRFGTGGISLQGVIAGTTYTVKSINRSVELADGRILAPSTLYDVSVNQRAAALRFSADGVLDQTFGDHGVFVVPLGSANPNGGEGLDLLELATGQFVLIGRALSNRTQPQKYSRSCTLIAAFDADGHPDTAFGGNAANGSFCFAFGSADPVFHSSRVGSGIVAADGGFYVSGPNTANDMIGVARLTDAGVLDTTFGTSGVCYLVNSRGTGLLRHDSQGSLIVAGLVAAQTPAPPEGQPVGAVRIDDDCVEDPAYSPHAQVEASGVANQEVVDAAFDSQDRLLLGIYDHVVAPADAVHAFVLARFRANGILDDTFNPSAQQPGMPGIAKLPIASSAYFEDTITGVLPTDRGIYVAGAFAEGPHHSILLARVLDDAAFDDSFGAPSTPGIALYSTESTVTAKGGVASGSHETLFLQGQAQVATVSCGVVLRVSIDSVFGDGFESVVAPSCPSPTRVGTPVR